MRQCYNFPNYDSFKSRLFRHKSSKNIDEYKCLVKDHPNINMREFFGFNSNTLITVDRLHISPEAFFHTKNMYNECFDVGLFGCFNDYLAYYNMSDCILAVKAFLKYTGWKWVINYIF